MSNIIDEMRAVLNGDVDTLAHVGVSILDGAEIGSGRYPRGSGENPYQHDGSFYREVNDLKETGWEPTPENIWKQWHVSTTEFRKMYSLSKDDQKLAKIVKAKQLAAEGKGPTEIGRIIDANEGTIRGWLKTDQESRSKVTKATSEFLENQIKEKRIIDVSKGVERELNVSSTRLKTALLDLKQKGYNVYEVYVEQATNPGNRTTQLYACDKDVPFKECLNLDNVKTITDYTSPDGGETFRSFRFPESMDSKRLMIRYRDDPIPGTNGETGIDRDGLVEIRRGVEDLSLGGSHYSQVRILVDGTHFIKGMAVYSDGKDMPDGVDVIFNTNKSSDKSMYEVLKPVKKDKLTDEVELNPFGSSIKVNGQSEYIGKDGKTHLSLINKKSEEGDWTEWRDRLPSQFLAKQSKSLAKQQLNIKLEDKKKELEEITSLTNPTLQRVLLSSFANDCDSAAVDLAAASLPGQKYHVIIPINTLGDNEVYAPNYENGTKLALVRYPHAGTFEIPILTVNNKNKEANKFIGKSVRDAVGINHNVAEILSGADFDGDTVMCIPTHNGKVKITNRNPLEDLKDFDNKLAYPEREGMRYMKNTGFHMGVVSNLISDMTLKGANDKEMARAVKHSLVVIDAEKHKLDYEQSEIDNDIAGLKRTYQRKIEPDGRIHYGGASTLLSKAKSPDRVLKRQGSPMVNQKGKPWYDPTRPEGALIYKVAKDAYYDKTKIDKRTGEEITVRKERTISMPSMKNTDNAYTLASDPDNPYPMERIYADYANSMKDLANQARLLQVHTGRIAKNSSAAKMYSEEVDSLMSKLDKVYLNKPRENAAQRMANIEKKRLRNSLEASGMSKNDINKEMKKRSQQILTKYREVTGAKRYPIDITDKEWEAIQSGAISDSKLLEILNKTDLDKLRERATPRQKTTISPAKINRIKAMVANGNKSIYEIAQAAGVSTATVYRYMKGDE